MSNPYDDGYLAFEDFQKGYVRNPLLNWRSNCGDYFRNHIDFWIGFKDAMERWKGQK